MAWCCVASLAAPTWAQTPDPLGTSPRGLVNAAPLRIGTAPSATAAGVADTAVTLAPLVLPLPPNPATAGRPIVFGSQMFSGRFATERGGGFNGDYRVAVGDRIALRLWGAFNFEAVQPVDPQGNLFVPNVGPVHVLGVRNAELNAQVEQQTKKVFRANVGVYASVEGSQPVRVFVSGFVRAPGLYSGLNSDSVLSYLDRAGGIDPDRGSHLQVSVLRSGQPRARLDLYRFLLDGWLEQVQLQDGDTIVAAPRGPTVQVSGEVQNPYVFEFRDRSIPAAELLALARPLPGATHMSIVRKLGADRRTEYRPLDAAASVQIEDGDDVTITSDRYPGTILVRLEGAHLGERALVLPYGAKLSDALARLRPAPQAEPGALQLFRKSVAVRQKELLQTSLRGLETYALTARSATSEEATLRTREAELIMQFVAKAKSVEPRGQVVLGRQEEARNTLLEDGDVIQVPEHSNLVLVSGEVLFPNAVVWSRNTVAEDYVRRAGGFNQGADKARVLVLHQDGSVQESTSEPLNPGDEIMVLPRIETKSVEVTRGLTQIIYQIAVAARILFKL
jgi:protein involved in polysaccharide export with SLBB domain